MPSENDQLRAMFAEKMRPEDVTVSEIYRLWCVLERCLHEQHGQRLEMEMVPMNDKVMQAVRRHGWPKRGVELHVKGPYFDRREAVTFSTSGFIGFCGWASGTNERPILDGFREWVETFQATPTEKGGA
jgi:hypothetical protein